MFWFGITSALIVIDQLSKWAAVHLGWSIFYNDKFAFSLPLPLWVMYLIYAAVLVAITLYVRSAWQRFNHQHKVAWCFVYAGGLSNVVERIFKGSVIDFIPIFNGMLNLADFFIITGLILMLITQRQALKS
jgi:lipoprotein signal peptidase